MLRVRVVLSVLPLLIFPPNLTLAGNLGKKVPLLQNERKTILETQDQATKNSRSWQGVWKVEKGDDL